MPRLKIQTMKESFVQIQTEGKDCHLSMKEEWQAHVNKNEFYTSKNGSIKYLLDEQYVLFNLAENLKPSAKINKISSQLFLYRGKIPAGSDLNFLICRICKSW